MKSENDKSKMELVRDKLKTQEKHKFAHTNNRNNNVATIKSQINEVLEAICVLAEQDFITPESLAQIGLQVLSIYETLLIKQ